jgi:uncharacterized membrane protein (UPF0182 family)
MRYYYTFNDIDIDRYNINGKYSQVFVSPREIDLEKIEDNTWQKRHLVYTHGYGLVMSKVNAVTPEGQPSFSMKNIPTENSTDIPIENPRIYFGEKTNYYAVVNTGTSEFDYPKGGENQMNKYDGQAGINMSLANKILFALKEKDFNFLISRDINSDSKILINRNIMDRVKNIAPFLNYDKDPYPVVSDNKIYWVIDAYTTSSRYPYAQSYNNINYIRNSVKITVDAYDGTTNFYIVDKNDPIAQSYNTIFSGLFKSVDEMPQDLKSHLKYPEQLFKVQSQVLSKYHMTDPRVFLTSEDLWQTSTNKQDENITSDESYVVMKMPNSNNVEMVLLDYFNVKDKGLMSSMYSIRMDGDNYGKMVLYKIPPNTSVNGPTLFNSKMQQDPTISKEISLWNAQGSKVEYGETVIMPIKDSLLYIRPMYLIAQGDKSIPEVKRIIMGYGDDIVIAENIADGLKQLFNTPSDSTKATQNPAQTPNTNNQTTQNDNWANTAKEYYQNAINAQKQGDWSKYGEYLNKLGELLNSVAK